MMDVVVEARGFELEPRSRGSVTQRAQLLLDPLGVVRLELLVTWQRLSGSDTDDPTTGYAATARIVLDDANAIVHTAEAERFTVAVDHALDMVARVVQRRRELAETATPCGRCGDHRFAYVAAWTDLPNVDALVCKGCGRVELYVRDPRALRNALDVNARTKPPYR